MRIHAIYNGTRANGPGIRTAVWLRGCLLGCVGCVNRSTWDFDGGKEMDPVLVAHAIFSRCLPGTEGVTVSGGEPLHQASSLLSLFREIRKRRPDFSLGFFTGYTWDEAASGSYQLMEPSSEGGAGLWDSLYRISDFIKMGRFEKSNQPGRFPLCSSGNQELKLPGMRYTIGDFSPNCLEFNIESDGFTTVTGFPI